MPVSCSLPQREYQGDTETGGGFQTCERLKRRKTGGRSGEPSGRLQVNALVEMLRPVCRAHPLPWLTSGWLAWHHPESRRMGDIPGGLKLSFERHEPENMQDAAHMLTIALLYGNQPSCAFKSHGKKPRQVKFLEKALFKYSS